jgi:hypothetical protein
MITYSTSDTANKFSKIKYSETRIKVDIWPMTFAIRKLCKHKRRPSLISDVRKLVKLFKSKPEMRFKQCRICSDEYTGFHSKFQYSRRVRILPLCPCESQKATKREPGTSGYNWAILSLGGINIKTRSSRLGVGRKIDELAL